MFKNELPAINALFPSAESGRDSVDFSWRLVRRRKRPFLLLPEKEGFGPDCLQLYSAHRPLAKLWRSLVPFLWRTTLDRIWDRIVVEADADSEFMQFLAEQSGLPSAQLPPPAIKFGGVAGQTMRLVLLLCDAGGHPLRIVKVGLNPAGRAATEREASLLAGLPKDVIGCTGITGRFTSDTLSAFATDYFSGQSLDTDLGIEKLFHDWLNDTPPEPIQDLPLWRELQSMAKGADLPQWPIIRDALAEHKVRTTIYHGDFAPWNIRMTNLENIRAFDWERGHLKGIPAWDWFHFIVQTAILVKRYSPERVAAELQHLIHSPRFQKYAADAGILDIVEPLLLAYLLEQKLVVRPLEGAEQIDRLFRLLWARWRHAENAIRPAAIRAVPAASPQLTAPEQIKSACVKLVNVFWQPSLSPQLQTPLVVQLLRQWPALLFSVLWIGGVAALQFHSDPHLAFTPFYLIPCVLPILHADRRLGLLMACVAGMVGPLVQHVKQPMVPISITYWNMLMRTVVFGLVIVLLDNVRRQSLRNRSQAVFPEQEQDPIQAIKGNWAVILVTAVYFGLVVVVDLLTNPFYIMLPLYVLPCIIFTLSLNWRWGTLAAVIASVAGPVTQRFEDPGFQVIDVQFWNTLMRLVLFQVVVLLLDKVRRQNILFAPSCK